MIKNIVFDLGGVVFSRDPRTCPKGLLEFFAFVARDDMPQFWIDYDLGKITAEGVKQALCSHNQCPYELSDTYLREAIESQQEVTPTKLLIQALKAHGYRLYVLSNMSVEFIDYLRRKEVYALFDGEVVSCEEHIVKPQPEIFHLLLQRYGLRADESLFVDDRAVNVQAAERLGFEAFLFHSHDAGGSCEELRKRLL